MEDFFWLFYIPLFLWVQVLWFFRPSCAFFMALSFLICLTINQKPMHPHPGSPSPVILTGGSLSWMQIGWERTLASRCKFASPSFASGEGGSSQPPSNCNWRGEFQFVIGEFQFVIQVWPLVREPVPCVTSMPPLDLRVKAGKVRFCMCPLRCSFEMYFPRFALIDG